MATLLSGENVSESWSKAASFLLRQKDHRIEHLVVSVQHPLMEVDGVRPIVDRLVPCEGTSSVIERVADTIFPEDLYDPNEDDAASQLYERRIIAREFEEWSVPSGNYFDRMCAYPQGNKKFNQVAHVLKRLKGMKSLGSENGNQCEIGISEADEEIRIQAPGLDRKIIGFPCLSHLSVTLAGGKVHLAATYRAQDFVNKAYGNLIGLGRFARFLARESKFEIGEVVCIATGAVLGSSPEGMGVIREVIRLTEELARRGQEA